MNGIVGMMTECIFLARVVEQQSKKKAASCIAPNGIASNINYTGEKYIEIDGTTSYARFNVDSSLRRKDDSNVE